MAAVTRRIRADEPDEPREVQEGSSEQLYTAQLVRGTVYYLGDMRLDAGVQTVIGAHHKDHLEEYAVESAGDADGEVLVKDKFLFKPYHGDLPIGSIVGVAPIAEDRDVEKEARLRAFREKEAQRSRQEPPAQAPKFDKAAARAATERTTQERAPGGEILSAPRPRMRPARTA